MSSALEFIEVPTFEAQRTEFLTDDEFRALQLEIIKNPEVGDLIVGTGGLRKVRLKSPNTGKSGGYRIIYFFVQPDYVYLIAMYKKGRKDTLTDAEKRDFKKLTAYLKDEVRP